MQLGTHKMVTLSDGFLTLRAVEIEVPHEGYRSTGNRGAEMPKLRSSKHFDPFAYPRKLKKSGLDFESAVTWAWTQKTTPREKSVLMAVAHHPGASVERIAGLCNLTTTATLEAIRELSFEELVYAVEDFGVAIALAVSQ